MKALALLIALASPVAAQDIPLAGQCLPLIDGLAWLSANGYRESAEGVLHSNGRLAIYLHDMGSFLVVVMDDAEACIAATGFGWGAVKPNV